MGLRGKFGRVLARGAGGLPEPVPAWSRPTPIGRAVPCIPPRPRPAGSAVARGAPAAPEHIPAVGPLLVLLLLVLPSSSRTLPSPSPAFFSVRLLSLSRHKQCPRRAAALNCRAGSYNLPLRTCTSAVWLTGRIPAASPPSVAEAAVLAAELNRHPWLASAGWRRLRPPRAGILRPPVSPATLFQRPGGGHRGRPGRRRVHAASCDAVAGHVPSTCLASELGPCRPGRIVRHAAGAAAAQEAASALPGRPLGPGRPGAFGRGPRHSIRPVEETHSLSWHNLPGVKGVF